MGLGKDRDLQQDCCGNCRNFIFLQDLPDGTKHGECHGSFPIALLVNIPKQRNPLALDQPPDNAQVPMGCWPPVRAHLWCRQFDANDELCATRELQMREAQHENDPSDNNKEMLAKARSGLERIKLAVDPVQGSS